MTITFALQYIHNIANSTHPNPFLINHISSTTKLKNLNNHLYKTHKAKNGNITVQYQTHELLQKTLKSNDNFYKNQPNPRCLC